MSPTAAVLLGSVVTALAIFGGGLAVETYKRRNDRAGMALALAGAIDALLRLIELRKVARRLGEAHPELAAGNDVVLTGLVGANGPFNAITLSYAARIGDLGGKLPFQVARFLTYVQGLQTDTERLCEGRDAPEVRAALIMQISTLWLEAESLGEALVRDLEHAARPRRGRRVRKTEGGIEEDQRG